MQPLDDITVVDLTQSIAGPVCTQLLASMGATVVKVEPPQGDSFRRLMDGAMFTPFNHGKRSLSVDLKTDAGREIVDELALEADVFVESFRPGVLERYDLDYDSLSARNEDVVYCSLSGFGRAGPYRDYPGYDPCVQAMSGLMATTGYADRPPVRIRASLIDCGTGANAAYAILAAIRQRDRGGGGTQIDVSLFDVAVAWMGYWIADYDQTGEIPERAGQEGMAAAPNGTFETGDGYIYVAALSDGMFERLCSVLERPDLHDDDRYATMDDRLENREALRGALHAAFAQFDARELERALLEANVPAGAVKTVRDIVEDDPHVEARDMIVESYNPETGESVAVPALPFRFADGFASTGFSSDPPAVGEHTVAVLEALSYDTGEIERLLESGAVSGPE